MTLHGTYKKLENDCSNLLTVDPNPPHDLKHFSLILRLENTVSVKNCGLQKLIARAGISTNVARASMTVTNYKT